MDTLPHNDQPIATPAEDRFGIDPFARALATSIRKLKSPAGSVIALNGPWGSGKSSSVNLIRHHLRDAVENEQLVLIDFTCWWFRGEDALALAFFRELYAGLAPTLGDKIKKALPKLGARLLRAGSVIGGVADAAGAGGIGTAAGGAMQWLGGLIQQEESVEKLHGELSKALAEQKRRFLIVIDDIDRLSPDEALLIFRLVKSVGRLPNVIYLLVYDRPLAENIVSERYPSEGPHYLEKIVQAAFELPEPTTTDVQRLLLDQIESICGSPSDGGVVRFMNIFHEGIAPAMRTPRDVARFTNSVSVTWPAVAGEVDLADFLALEVLRLLYPMVHRATRQNKELMCRGARNTGRDREGVAEWCREMLLGSVQAPDRERLRRLLMRLFPALESVWGNMNYSDDFVQQWARERRVCSMSHFDSYFRFAVGDEVLPRAELDEFIQRAKDHDYVIATMRHALTVTRRTGGTKAAVLLNELATHADRVGQDLIRPLLTALFTIADELDIEADEAGSFGFVGNQRRLYWLLRRLVLERMTLAERSDVLVRACETAQLGWIAELWRRVQRDYHPLEGKAPKPSEQCLIREDDARCLRDILLARIEAAAEDGTLAEHRELTFLLFVWSDIADDDGTAVRAWTSALYASDAGVRQLAKAFTSFQWSQQIGFGELGDVVAKRTACVQMEDKEKIVDLVEFRRRVEEAAANSVAEAMDFLKMWRNAGFDEWD